MGAAVPFDLPASRLDGRVAVVTGASRGLGAGLAARFAHHGIRLGLCARTEPDAPAQVDSVCRSVDVTDAAALGDFADEVVEQLGPIDLWVNNAGVLEPIGPARSLDATEVERALLVNIGGVVHGSRVFAERARGWPTGLRVLVNISSGAATSVYEGWSVYGATKAAVAHFTEVVAAEEPDLAAFAVAPGVVDTDMQELIRDQDEATFPAVGRFREMVSDGSFASTDWVADHVAGLLAATLRPDGCRYRVPDEPH